MDEKEIYIAANSGIEWLKDQDITVRKDLSRSIQRLSLWDEKLSILWNMAHTKKGLILGNDKPLLDTARACSALSGCDKADEQL